MLTRLAIIVFVIYFIGRDYGLTEWLARVVNNLLAGA